MRFTEDLGFDHIRHQNFILFYIIQYFTASGLAGGSQEPFLTVVLGWGTMGPRLKIVLDHDNNFPCEFIQEKPLLGIITQKGSLILSYVCDLGKRRDNLTTSNAGADFHNNQDR